MGRHAGVTRDETGAAILAAAAKVFAKQGYDGASIAEITTEAGLSSGPVYGHFGSKAELFAATLEAHSERELDDFLGATAARDVPSVLTALGANLIRQQPARRSLLVEAVVASRRDPAVAALMSSIFARRRLRLATLIEGGQAEGDIDVLVSAQALARFSVILGLGALLMSALEQGDVDEPEWQHLIDTVVDGFRPR